jgi:spermidine synthase
VFGKVLFLDKELQSSSYDEKIYHEFLVHPVMMTMSKLNNMDVLVVGGGEGATVREVLKWSNVLTIDWVDLDNELVELCKKYMNYTDESVYSNIKVNYVPDDILNYLYVSNKKYDVIIIDLPDPECDEEVEHKLYTKLFWNYVLNALKDHGAVSTHCGPVMYGKEETNKDGLEYVRKQTNAVGFEDGCFYHINIPSFQSEWGFWMSTKPNMNDKTEFPTDCVVIDNENFEYACYFPKYYFSDVFSNKE